MQGITVFLVAWTCGWSLVCLKTLGGVWIWPNFLEAIGNSGGGIELGLEMLLWPNNFVEPR